MSVAVCDFACKCNDFIEFSISMEVFDWTHVFLFQFHKVPLKLHSAHTQHTHTNHTIKPQPSHSSTLLLQRQHWIECTCFWINDACRRKNSILVIFLMFFTYPRTMFTLYILFNGKCCVILNRKFRECEEGRSKYEERAWNRSRCYDRILDAIFLQKQDEMELFLFYLQSM